MFQGSPESRAALPAPHRPDRRGQDGPAAGAGDRTSS